MVFRRFCRSRCFFVISGYLITTILLKELSEGEFSIVKFYGRRARRILPALFFVVFCCIPFAWAWLLTQDLKDFSQALVAICLFSSNAFFWIKSGILSQKPMRTHFCTPGAWQLRSSFISFSQSCYFLSGASVSVGYSM